MQRPKRGETEQDLLKLQSEFLQSGPSTSNSASKLPTKRRPQGGKDGSPGVERRDVVRMEGVQSPVSLPTPSKKSKFQTGKSVEFHTTTMGGDDDVEEMMDRKETGIAAVLTNIIERDTRNQMVSAPALSRQAFPTVLHNENLSRASHQPQSDATDGKKRKKKSLFAQHVEARTAKEFGVDRPAAILGTPPCSSGADTDKVRELMGPCVIDGKGLSASQGGTEALKIHEENLGKLSSMSEDEINEERSKLLESIDPKLLSYLKRRRQDKQTEEASSQSPRGDNSQNAASSSYSVQKTRKNRQTGKTDAKFDGPVKPEKGWLNMGVVEKDKMEWMNDLPPPDSISSQTGKSARFDFDGNLVAVDEDIPVNVGLHHHGEEPERAGYNLQELFILARSSNLQQRILSLHTLAKIIQKAKCGHLLPQTEGPVIPVLLDGGLVLLLRWALDDSVEGVVFAAIHALHALLCNPLDEEATDSNWTTFLGHLGVTLTPNLTLEKWSEPADLDEENKEEETDGEMMKRDVVEALVRTTHLLTRFGFIFHTMKPQAPVVVKMLAVLCRVAQHSSNMAYEIFKKADLLDKIVKEFLPTAWHMEDLSQPTSDVYGLPVPGALRLMRCLAQTGKNMCASLVSKYYLPTVLLRFLAVDEKNLHLPALEALNMKKESLALWRVMAAYSLGTQTFFDMYEVIIHQISRVGEDWPPLAPQAQADGRGKGDDGHDNNKTRVGQTSASLVSVLEMVVCGVTTTPGTGSSNEQRGVSSNLPLHWSHVTNLFQPIRSFLTGSLQTIGGTYAMQKQDLALPTACLNFLASFYEMEGKQAGLDLGARLEELEGLCKDCLIPFLSSFGLAVMRENLCSFSNMLSSAWSTPSEVTASLPTLNVIDDTTGHTDADTDTRSRLNIPSLLPHCPFPFLVSLFRLVLNVCRRHKALIPQLVPPLSDNPDVLVYMKKACQISACPLGSSHWTRTENLLHFLWLKACVLVPCSNMSLAHRVSLRLLSRLPKGDDFLVHDLMTSVVFSPAFIVEGQEPHLASEAISSLSLSESLYLRSATQEDIACSKSQLLREAHASLAVIRGHFLQALGGMEKEVMESRSVHTGHVQTVQHLMTSCDMESLMPLDWTFLPLIHVYNKAVTMKSLPGSEMTSKDVAMVTSVLQWAYLLESERPKEVDNVSPVTRLSRLMCAFIAGNEMFLEKGVQKYLAGLFREMTSRRNLDKLNPEDKVPGISSFYDLYQEFLDHYESVSFGDPVFGLYVLLPLQQRFGSLYRKAVWGERRKMLRTLRISLQQMLIPIENFLQPEEADVELIQLYAQAMVSGSLRKEWSPVLFLIAVHHLNRFLFISHDDGNTKVRERLWKLVAVNYQRLPVIVYYLNYNATLSDGLECYLVLPANRQQIFNRHVLHDTTGVQTPSLLDTIHNRNTPPQN